MKGGHLLLACLPALAPQWAPAQSPQRIETLQLPAPGLASDGLRVRVLLPHGYAGDARRYPVLYLNDGQDLEAVDAAGIVTRLQAAGAIRPLLLVAIDMPPDRIAGYGYFDRVAAQPIVARTRYGEVGANAQRYAAWLTATLVPAIDARYRTRADRDGRAILGWSLGAASAFGIGWQHPELFGWIGAFSPSFWLSTGSGEVASVQAGRIAHRLAAATPVHPQPALYVAVGDAEEASDRDRDGVIDVLDDAADLMAGQRADGDTLVVLRGGHHDQAGWKRMLPGFLLWAFGHE